MTNPRAYQNAYQNRWRAAKKARGLCVCCPAKAKRGRTPSGGRYSRCQRCIDLHARWASITRLKRRRLGRCTTCPTGRVTAKSWQCRRCLSRGRHVGRRRAA